jgi:hypothetical protein
MKIGESKCQKSQSWRPQGKRAFKSSNSPPNLHFPLLQRRAKIKQPEIKDWLSTLPLLVSIRALSPCIRVGA